MSEGDQSHLPSAHVREQIDAWMAKFPHEGRKSALLQALMAVQHDNGGWVSAELMDAVADYMDLPRVSVYEVATFYSMIETAPTGRHSVSICTNVSCMLCGADELVAHVERRLGCRRGETTADGRIFLKQEEECLAACSGAPMMQVDHVYYTDLTPEKVDEILDQLE
ncbi:MAG: NADH-quinone oxidoreductase subunit NuoE [Halofilum sp. (in: g-proteobacteria)]|nr:NADH-quinone oxidoreductase subunit NuoE [Halofilum sp. (in: g-proteobacteria)]